MGNLPEADDQAACNDARAADRDRYGWKRPKRNGIDNLPHYEQRRDIEPNDLPKFGRARWAGRSSMPLAACKRKQSPRWTSRSGVSSQPSPASTEASPSSIEQPSATAGPARDWHASFSYPAFDQYSGLSRLIATRSRSQSRAPAWSLSAAAVRRQVASSSRVCFHLSAM
jgi:hypothetical protein